MIQCLCNQIWGDRMARIELGFADGFYVSQTGPYLEKRVVNLYPVIPMSETITQRALFHTPGIKQFADAVTGTSRGVFVFSDGTPYRVIGNTLWSFDSFGNKTDRGNISGASDVSMDSNGINIAIVDPTGNSYFYTPSTNILELSSSSSFLSFGQATSVSFKDGFYVYTTDIIFFSSSAKTVNDGKDFNPLDFADAEINPDLIRKGINDHNQLYILGDTTTQVYRTIKTAGFPFQVIPGAVIPKGCAAPNSTIPFDRSFLFIGGGVNEKPGVYRVLGSSVEKISNQSIDHLIHSNSDAVISNARAFSYAENGNHFAVFTVGNNTFVYDQTTSQLSGKPEWHERQSGVTNGTGFKAWRGIHGAKAFGDIQVGDDRTAMVGTLDSSTYKDYGSTIERFWTTKPFMNSGNSIFSHEVELVMQTGLGTAEVPDPQIRMDYSDNMARSFNSELSKSMGKVGEYKIRVRWTRLGRIPLTRVLRWKTTEPVPINIFGLFGDAEVTGG
jgi:hypothetical protein